MATSHKKSLTNGLKGILCNIRVALADGVCPEGQLDEFKVDFETLQKECPNSTLADIDPHLTPPVLESLHRLAQLLKLRRDVGDQLRQIDRLIKLGTVSMNTFTTGASPPAFEEEHNRLVRNLEGFRDKVQIFVTRYTSH